MQKENPEVQTKVIYADENETVLGEVDLEAGWDVIRCTQRTSLLLPSIRPQIFRTAFVSKAQLPLSYHDEVE